MEASRICFGLKTLPNIHNTTLSNIPRRLLQTNTLSYKKPTKHDLFCVKAETSVDLESTRPLTYFPPDVWGDHFLSVPIDDSEFETLEREIESLMKPKVRGMLMSPHSSNKEKTRLIHLLISLGIAHYFESEIEEILHLAFGKLDSLISKEDDLETMAIMFEVFRIYGHKCLVVINNFNLFLSLSISLTFIHDVYWFRIDVFGRFKGEDGRFKQSLAKDVRGMLQLYEAAHLAAPFEDIMDETITFTRYHLDSLTGHETSHKNVLYRARYRSIEILVAQQYISFYEKEVEHDQMLLRFAKLNFNFCQMHYIIELRILTEWWKELGMVSKLPHIRDRNVETFLMTLGIFFEPRYSLGRVLGTKLTMLLNFLDDTFDAFATLPEAISLTNAFQRWDVGAIEELPSYMRIIFQTVTEVVEEIDREMKSRGQYGTMQLAIDEMKSVTMSYLAVAKWARTGHVPSFEEYMEVGLVSATMDDIIAHSFITMDDCDEKQFNEWFNTKPKILKALSAVFHFRNDIVTYEHEMSRGEVANGVNCYMKQYGVTKEAATKELSKRERENYKIMMDEFMTSKAMPRQVLVRVVNTGRVIDVYYREGDAFAYPDQKMKDLLASLLLHPFRL